MKQNVGVQRNLSLMTTIYIYNCFIPPEPNVSKFIAGVEDLDLGLHT